MIAGKGEKTIDQLNIKQRSKIEELLGLWEDGKPIEKLMSDGDGTVLLVVQRQILMIILRLRLTTVRLFLDRKESQHCLDDWD